MVRTRRRHPYHTGYLLLALIVAVSCADAVARARPPRPVLDYYLLLPGDYFDGLANPHSRSERLHWVREIKGSVVDIPNGYLHVHGDGAQPSLTMCVFRRPDHTYLAAAASNYSSDGQWDPSYNFYTYRGGRLVDVTRRVLPVRIRQGYGLALPRHGRTIHVIKSTGRRMYDLVWLGDRFQVRGL